jgi:hypothetical protein
MLARTLSIAVGVCAAVLATAVGSAAAQAVEPTGQKDSTAGAAVFFGVTIVVIAAIVVLSLKYRKR